VTLETVIPSLRSTLYQHVDPAAWPLTTAPAPGGDLAVGGVGLASLAARFGTPATVLDLDDVAARLRGYRTALPDADVAYAGKALLCAGLVPLLVEAGVRLDVCSGGELALALRAGMPADRIVVHGNAPTEAELDAAVRARVGRVVVDSLDVADRLAAVASRHRVVVDVLLRVAPGVDAGGHPAIRTGGDDQKFGVPLAGGRAAAVAGAIAGRRALRLVGLHCHLGSQIADTTVWERAVDPLLDLAAELPAELSELNLGGGHAVTGGTPFDLAGFARRVTGAVARGCAARGLPPLRLGVEPGRAIVARAGVTLYRVQATKCAGSGRWFVAVDGGMGDNPRVALYGAAYDAHLVGRTTCAAWKPATVVGRFCEAGDVLARDVALPEDVTVGDLVAVPGTGAYHHAMASSYNLVGRPPLVGVRDGVARVLVRRETTADLLARDCCLPRSVPDAGSWDDEAWCGGVVLGRD
jgi:diaminopimelate decarboxylase